MLGPLVGTWHQIFLGLLELSWIMLKKFSIRPTTYKGLNFFYTNRPQEEHIHIFAAGCWRSTTGKAGLGFYTANSNAEIFLCRYGLKKKWINCRGKCFGSFWSFDLDFSRATLQSECLYQWSDVMESTSRDGEWDQLVAFIRYSWRLTRLLNILIIFKLTLYLGTRTDSPSLLEKVFKWFNSPFFIREWKNPTGLCK